MTTFLKTLRKPRVALMTLLGCILSLGIFFFVLKGCNSLGDMSIVNPHIYYRLHAVWHIYAKQPAIPKQ